ncbi:MAG TPA: phage holin family protein [Ohtaekwangia sp.]|uniref:phage holin family protein n=1 Tax=Ohtaekwangia sp. TaxID=2066019 RepID=UPI002F9283DE
MAELKTKTENLVEHAGDYFETQIRLAMLSATDKATGIASQSLLVILVSVLALFVLLFSGLGFSWWIGHAIDNMVGGFFIVAGIYGILIAIVFLLYRKHLAPVVRNFLIARIYE